MQKKTVTFSVPSDLKRRLHSLAFNARISRSSIVEIALVQFLDGRTDEEIAEELLSHGARLRREPSHDEISAAN